MSFGRDISSMRYVPAARENRNLYHIALLAKYRNRTFVRLYRTNEVSISLKGLASKSFTDFIMNLYSNFTLNECSKLHEKMMASETQSLYKFVFD